MPGGGEAERRPAAGLDSDVVARLSEREFPYRVGHSPCADAAWESEGGRGDRRLPRAGAPTAASSARTGGDGIRYAYFGGRKASPRADGRVTEGLLFEVSGRLTSDPDRFPSDGRRFRELGEAIVTDAPELLAELRKAYRP